MIRSNSVCFKNRVSFHLTDEAIKFAYLLSLCVSDYSIRSRSANLGKSAKSRCKKQRQIVIFRSWSRSKENRFDDCKSIRRLFYSIFFVRNIDHWKDPLYVSHSFVSVIINKSAWHTYCRLGTRTIIYVNLWSCTHVFACQTAEQLIFPLPSHPCVINVDTEFSFFTKFQCQIRNTWTLSLSRSVQCKNTCH